MTSKRPASLEAQIKLLVRQARLGHVRTLPPPAAALPPRPRRPCGDREAFLHAEKAQQLAREEIAREIRGIPVRRLTLFSLRTGVLEFRPGAPKGAAGLREEEPT